MHVNGEKCSISICSGWRVDLEMWVPEGLEQSLVPGRFCGFRSSCTAP